MIRKILKKKRNQMHVEMIISFIIFVGFLIAIFFLINPLVVKKPNYILLNNIQEKLIENLSFEYSSVSLTLDEGLTFSQDCFIIQNPFNRTGILKVHDSSGNILKSLNEVNTGLRIGKSERYYKLYFSDNFNPSEDPGSCSALDSANYSFGILYYKKEILYDVLIDFNNLYMSDYYKLKNDLHIEGDFEFVVLNITKGVLLNDGLSKHKMKNINILSRDIPLKTLDKNSKERDIILNLRVW